MQPDPVLVAAIEARLAEHGGRLCGVELRFRCVQPDHDDVHPSARWSTVNHAWYCDVCGVGGGAVDLAHQLGIAVGGRRLQARTVRRAIARRDVERREHVAQRQREREAVIELREAQADVYLLGALVRSDPDELDPHTSRLLDEMGDPYLREQLAEQHLDEIERAWRATRDGVCSAAV